MITLLIFWIACRYNEAPAMLYVGTVCIDLFALDIIGNLLCKKDIENKKENGDDE